MVEGEIKKNHDMQRPKNPALYRATLTIKMGTNQSVYATIVDPQDVEHDFAKRIKADMDSSEKPRKFQEIASDVSSDVIKPPNSSLKPIFRCL